MRNLTYARFIRRLADTAAMIAGPAGLSGCSVIRSTVGAYETGPHGIARPQQQLREALARSDFAEAFGWKEDDALLRALNVGVSSYYAAQFARSASVLDSAALLADDRITASVSRNALSLVTNDMARPYQPRRTERLFIPYYGMLAYARLEQWEDAAVEARRVSALLAQYAADRTESERSTHAALSYLAGTVFERAGEKTDAEVAYPLARSLATEPADSSGRKPAANEGEVLLVVERGFVAHRATEAINVFFSDDDRDSSHTFNAERKPRIREGRRRDHHDDEDGYWLAVALPSLRRAPRASGELQAFIDGAATEGTRLSTVLDDAASADEARERTGMLARATARAAAKYALTKAVKDKKGEIAGNIANIGASLLERADIRSWHLLPQEITVLRVRAKAGMHHIEVGLDDADAGRTDVGPVSVHAGQVTIATVRVWSDPARRTLASR
jgi:uncharacterized protein